MVRLGGPVYGDCSTPEAWVASTRRHGYRAAFCPVDASAGEDVVNAYSKAAAAADIAIAEVGAWSNPLSPDDGTRRAALENCERQLALADRIGARCCVNIAGSRGAKWDGPAKDDLTKATFDMIVETVRTIIDAVKPRRSCYSLETMPWMYPDSVESYEKLLKAIDRPHFAVHFDPVNLVCSPQRYFANGDLMREFVQKLGKHIKSCHAKDIILADRLTTHLDEARPGLGALDYPVFLKAIHGLSAEVPVMLEHLATEEDYKLAADHIRKVAGETGVPV